MFSPELPESADAWATTVPLLPISFSGAGTFPCCCRIEVLVFFSHVISTSLCHRSPVWHLSLHLWAARGRLASLHLKGAHEVKHAAFTAPRPLAAHKASSFVLAHDLKKLVEKGWPFSFYYLTPLLIPLNKGATKSCLAPKHSFTKEEGRRTGEQPVCQRSAILMLWNVVGYSTCEWDQNPHSAGSPRDNFSSSQYQCINIKGFTDIFFFTISGRLRWWAQIRTNWLEPVEKLLWICSTTTYTSCTKS